MSARRLSRSRGRQPLRVLERLDVRAQARDRRAQLVARVGHEVALRLDRALERVERGVEAAREARQLVAALGFDALRGVGVAGELLGAPREAATGASAVRATSAPRPAPSATPAAPTSISTSTTRSSWRSISSSGRATCSAPRAPAARREHAQVRPLGGRVGEVLAAPAARDLERVRIDRQRLAGARRPNHAARRAGRAGRTLRAAEGLGRAEREGRGGRAVPGRSPARRPAWARAPAAIGTDSAPSRSESSTSPRSSPRTPR